MIDPDDYFNSDSDPELDDDSEATAALLLPLSSQRIIEHFDENNLYYGIDDDGDITAYFEDDLFWFIVHGEENSVLQIRGRASYLVNPARLSDALLMLNDAHREYIYPTLFIIEEQTGMRVMANYSTLSPVGLTDHQFETAITNGVSRIVATFRRLESQALGDVFLPAEDDPEED